jgi:hypothetical protein
MANDLSCSMISAHRHPLRDAIAANAPYLLNWSKLKRKSSIVSSRADGLFEKFEISRGKGRSGSGLPVTIPGGVSAGAGASEYVALGALTGGEEVQFPKRSGNEVEREGEEFSSDGMKGTAGAPASNADTLDWPVTRQLDIAPAWRR